jgi:hypothetical protein
MIGGLLLALGLGPAGRAQDEDSRTVTGFRVPEYDAESRLKSELFGDFAKVLPDGVIEITRLKIDFYSGDKVTMTVTAPGCTYHQKQGKAESDGDVRIVRDNMDVTGVGFSWSGRDERFKIFSQVKVVLKEVRRRIETGAEE